MEHKLNITNNNVQLVLPLLLLLLLLLLTLEKFILILCKYTLR